MKPSLDLGKEPTTPVIMEEVQQTRNRGVTSKHVILAVVSLLTVCVVVAGFLGGFYIMKQSTSESSQAMSKVFALKVKAGHTTVNEEVTTNIQDRTTETEEKFDNTETVVFQDFKKGITVMVDNQRDRCYVQPLNRSQAMEPEVLEKYLESHPNPEDPEDREQDLRVVLGQPIADPSFLGQRPNDLCFGKKIFWIYPAAQTRESERQKRETCYRYCRYYYDSDFNIYRICFNFCI